MTTAQIDLEFELILLDKRRKDAESGGEVYGDDNFATWDNETDGEDSNDGSGAFITLPKSENTTEYEDEWEEVEIHPENP